MGARAGRHMKYLIASEKGWHSMLTTLPRRLAGWAILGAAALLVPASVYAWQHASADKSSPDQSAQSGHSTANVSSSSISSSTDNHSGPIQAQLKVHTSTGQAAAGGGQPSSGHISASVSGNTSATVDVNGHATTLSPNSSIDQSVSSNGNSTNLNITMNSSSTQDVSGSSAISVQVTNNSGSGQ